MRILRLLVTLFIGLGLVVTVQAAPSAHAATSAAVKVAARRSPDHYNVQGGVTFNEPYGRHGHSWRAIRRHILRTINTMKRGDHIKIASWNVRGRPYTDSLIKAHHRGVSVQVIMDRGNANPRHPNPDVARMVRAFRGDGNRKASNRSWVKKCRSSCRGTSGIPHSKFFLFDRVGKKRYVTMYSSNNATDVAAHDQWNDLMTFVGRKAIYNKFVTVFNQMRQDRSRGKNTLLAWKANKSLTFNFYPWVGTRAKGDPDLKRLNQIRCKGARGGTGWRGHTKIRIAQDALLSRRGIRIAHRLVHMRRHHCDIRLVYSLLGGKVRKILKAGHVPMLQYSYDRNRDGMYDIYLHMKAMAISGVFRGKHDARVVFNGTANWTPVALASDEVVVRIASRAVMRKYVNWIDFLFNNRPARWGPDNLGRTTTTSMVNGRRIVKKIDPYALMKREGL